MKDPFRTNQELLEEISTLRQRIKNLNNLNRYVRKTLKKSNLAMKIREDLDIR